MDPMHLQPRARVLALTAKAFGISLDDLTGKSRKRSFAHARFAAIWVIRQRWPNFSQNLIGAMLSGRDHTSIHHGYYEAIRLRERDARFRAITDLLLAEREWQGPVAPLRVVPAPSRTVEQEAAEHERAQIAREVDEAAHLERNWTAALAQIRRGSRDLLRAIAREHPLRVAA